jgi:hypothetical protein
MADQTIDINCLEFIVVILQFAAAIERFKSLPPAVHQPLFPDGTTSQFPILLVKTDNTSAATWARKLSTSTAKNGHQLVLVFAELLRQSTVGINSEHIPDVDNDVADFLSRPPSLTPTRCDRLAQIFQRYSFLQTWHFFLPSPKLLQRYSSSTNRSSENHVRIDRFFQRV